MTHTIQKRRRRATRAKLVAAVAAGLVLTVAAASPGEAAPGGVQARNVAAGREVGAFQAANLFERRVADASASLNARWVPTAESAPASGGDRARGETDESYAARSGRR